MLTEKQKQFIRSIWPGAVANEKANGVPALFEVAQCCLESGYGVKVQGNNLFGIKADPRWKGNKILVTTSEVHKTPNVKYPVVLSVTKRDDGKYNYKVKDYFRAYGSFEESFSDHSSFLKSNPRYADAFKTTDPKQFAEKVAQAGYATAPNYATILKSMIDSIAAVVKS